MTVVSSLLTFPNVSWWAGVASADVVLLDTAEHFQKMSYRNRYRISGANNAILLSVPLVHGRNQHLPMAEVYIHNAANWQTQHWRTLVSAYRRTPYFDHYEHSLQPLFETKFDRLIDFNRAGIEWVRSQLRLSFEIKMADVYQKEYEQETLDLRDMKEFPAHPIKYYQIFEDRIGFIPDLSILDLLFSEGPAAKDLLLRKGKENI